MAEDALIVLGAVTPLAGIVSLWILAQISRRFGEVTHRPPFYRGFYLAMGLLVIPFFVRLLSVGQSARQRNASSSYSTSALLHDIPLAAAVTIGVVVAWYYWGWLVTTPEGRNPSTRRHDD